VSAPAPALPQLAVESQIRRRRTAVALKRPCPECAAGAAPTCRGARRLLELAARRAYVMAQRDLWRAGGSAGCWRSDLEVAALRGGSRDAGAHASRGSGRGEAGSKQVRRSLRGLRFGHVNATSSSSAHIHRWALCTAAFCAALTLCRFIYPNGKPPSMPVVHELRFWAEGTAARAGGCLRVRRGARAGVVVERWCSEVADGSCEALPRSGFEPHRSQ
jgi:hypothetical protein